MRRLAGDYPDGRRIRRWMDPDGGSPDDHALFTIVAATAFGLFTGALALLMTRLAVESSLTALRAPVPGPVPVPDWAAPPPSRPGEGRGGRETY